MYNQHRVKHNRRNHWHNLIRYFWANYNNQNSRKEKIRREESKDIVRKENTTEERWTDIQRNWAIHKNRIIEEKCNRSKKSSSDNTRRKEKATNKFDWCFDRISHWERSWNGNESEWQSLRCDRRTKSDRLGRSNWQEDDINELQKETFSHEVKNDSSDDWSEETSAERKKQQFTEKVKMASNRTERLMSWKKRRDIENKWRNDYGISTKVMFTSTRALLNKKNSEIIRSEKTFIGMKYIGQWALCHLARSHNTLTLEKVW